MICHDRALGQRVASQRRFPAGECLAERGQPRERRERGVGLRHRRPGGDEIGGQLHVSSRT